MILYAETNFALELAYLQRDSTHCDEILRLAEKNAKLSFRYPAYSLGEPLESATRRFRRRRDLLTTLDEQLRELARSKPYEAIHTNAQALQKELADSQDEEGQRLDDVLQRIATVARLLPLDALTLSRSVDLRREGTIGGLQDSLVLASVLRDLEATTSAVACFVTTNKSDFNSPDIEDALGAHGCKLLFSFESAHGYCSSRLAAP